MRIAFLTCDSLISTAASRAADAFEHDAELSALRAGFAAGGHQLEEVDWRACDPADDTYDLLLLRTVWNYTDHPRDFLAFMDRAAPRGRLANAPALVYWTINKRYLADLAAAGLPVIPSAFSDRPRPVSDLFDVLNTDEIVLKPVLGAGGHGQRRVTRAQSARDPMLPADWFAQPFLPSILSTGEISYVFLNGGYSHAVVKRARAGEFRIQSVHGGQDAPYTAPAEEIALARRFIDALPVPALAARIDMIRHGDTLLLIELEVIEPYLYPVFEPAFGTRFHQATMEYLTGRPSPDFV